MVHEFGTDETEYSVVAAVENVDVVENVDKHIMNRHVNHSSIHLSYFPFRNRGQAHTK